MTIYWFRPYFEAVPTRVRPAGASVAAVISLALAVSACGATQPRRVPEPVVMAPAPAPPPVTPTAKPPPPKPAPPKSVAKAAPAPAPVQQDPQTEAPATTPVIAQVIGMSQDDLRSALGEPTERIDQGPGQAWIYKTPKCTVEVLFFLDVTRNGYYALDRKISGAPGSGPSASGNGDLPERACYTEIQNARHR